VFNTIAVLTLVIVIAFQVSTYLANRPVTIKLIITTPTQDNRPRKQLLLQIQRLDLARRLHRLQGVRFLPRALQRRPVLGRRGGDWWTDAHHCVCRCLVLVVEM